MRRWPKHAPQEKREVLIMEHPSLSSKKAQNELRRIINNYSLDWVWLTEPNALVVFLCNLIVKLARL